MGRNRDTSAEAAGSRPDRCWARSSSVVRAMPRIQGRMEFLRATAPAVIVNSHRAGAIVILRVGLFALLFDQMSSRTYCRTNLRAPIARE